MSDDFVAETSKTARSSSKTSDGKQLSNNARYKRRMRLYANHRKLFPHDKTYEHLQIPHFLKTVVHPPRRWQPPKQQSTSAVPETLSRSRTSSFNCSSADESHCRMEVDQNPNGTVQVESVQLSATSNDDGFADDNCTAIENDDTKENDEEDDDDNMDQEKEPSSDEDANNAFNLEEVEDEDSSTDEEECATEISSNGDNTDTLHEVNDETSTPIRFRGFVTNFIIIMSYLAIAIRSKLTYATLLQLFRTLKKLTIGSDLPCYMKKLLAIFSNSDDSTCIRYYYCRKCQGQMKKGSTLQETCTCGECGPGKENKFLSYFIAMKMQPQLQQLFSDASFIESLKYRFERRQPMNGDVQDIYDGEKYKELCKPGGFLNNENNFSFGIFADGCKASESSNASAWPIMLVINELPPHARKRHMILAAIWVDTMHPILNNLLLPNVMELNYLYDTGIVWKRAIDNREITSKFTTIVCTADSVARYEIMNMTRFNGNYGCTFCYSKGKMVTNNGTSRRVYPLNSLSNCRTDAKIRRDMKIAHETKKRVNGVVGFSSMVLLKGFDLASGVIVDSMHNVYLGVAKFHTSLLLNMKSTSCNGHRYPGKAKKIEEIDACLVKMRPPTRISRTPRSSTLMKQWKASEWRNWIQFYALKCLDGLIEEKYHKHLALFSCASYILNKDCISETELAMAHTLLERYVSEFQTLFGEKNMRYNIHLLTHLTKSVTNWGPFWTHGAFPYEAWNKRIIDKITSPNSRPLQIVTRYMLLRYVEKQLNNPRVNNETKNLIKSILNGDSKRKTYVIDCTAMLHSRFQVIGAIAHRSPSDRESRAIELAGYAPPQSITIYRRAIINGIDVTSRGKDEKKETKYCNRYIYFKTLKINGFGDVIDIIDFRSMNSSVVSGLLVQKLKTCQNAFNVEHIKQVETTTELIFLVFANHNVSQVIPAIMLGTVDQDKRWISKLPNIWETD